MPSYWKKKWIEVNDCAEIWAAVLFGMPNNPPSKRERSVEGNDRGLQPPKKIDSKLTPTKNSRGMSNSSRAPLPPPAAASTGQGATNNVTEEQGQSDDGAAAAAATNGATGSQTVAGSYKATFADKVKKKPKEQFPWALYIVSGENGFDSITRKHFNAFHRKVIDKALSLTDTESEWINIDFVVYRDTFGVIACSDRYTANWIKSIAASFMFEGHNTSGFNRWERVESWVFYGFIHGESWKKLKGSYVVGTALKKMKLDAFTFTNLTWDTRPKTGVFLQFEPEPRLAALLSVEMRLKVGGQKIRLKKRLRKQYTEEEWLQKLEQNEIDDELSGLNIEDDQDMDTPPEM